MMTQDFSRGAPPGKNTCSCTGKLAGDSDGCGGKCVSSNSLATALPGFTKVPVPALLPSPLPQKMPFHMDLTAIIHPILCT